MGLLGYNCVTAHTAADRIRIQHMLDAAAEAAAFMAGRTAEDLSRDRMLLMALVKEIEIVGEAAPDFGGIAGQRSGNPVGQN